jgi:hypothetical protein
MKRLVVYGIALLVLSGCGWGSFQVPKQEFQNQVQVLGVLPLLVDRDAPLDYPQKEALFDLIDRTNLGKHEILVSRLKAKKGYFDVRPLTGNPELLRLSLLSARKPANQDGRPRGYEFNAVDAAELSRRLVVDALLVVVFSGAQVEETRRSRTLLESLKTTYNDLMVTAAVVGRDGQILWELSGEDSYQALPLQYPDFDEAHFNRTDLVQLKYVSQSGVERTLEETTDNAGKTQPPATYGKLFERIVASISPSLLDRLR